MSNRHLSCFVDCCVSVDLLEPRRLLAVTLTDEALSVGTLAIDTYTLTGTAELHVTAAGSPVPDGATVNLNSKDAWLYVHNVKPSVVNATVLDSVRVNGLPAVHDSTVRVVQHEMGTVVIPHSPSYRPLEIFTGPQFTGQAKLLDQYTYYDSGARLDEHFGTISSFKLNHGYMATFATNTDGSGPSKVYIAQDHDIDVSLMPSDLENTVKFVRVFPWRWVAKKGASDLGPGTLNAQWNYNWNNSQLSSLDHEYVPIRQQRYWPALPTNKPDSTHLLGFNEPDNPVEDAYQTLDNGNVETALSVWPQLMTTGLRLGSPAVTDGGKAWLYEFMDKAIQRDLRVDFIAIHNYQANHTAGSLYTWLKDIYDRYQLPIWVTEFNNGANWTSSPDPTYQQNAQWIADITNMFDNTPWIERYSVYSRVEATRQMTYDQGGLTPAGQVYFNNESPIGYRQEPVPNNRTPGVAEYLFDGSALDTSGNGNHGQIDGPAKFVSGQRGRALNFDGETNLVRLSSNLARGGSMTFAAWYKWEGGPNWQRIFDFGNGTSSYLFLTPGINGNLRFAIRDGGPETVVQTAAPAIGQWAHVAVTLGGGQARLYLNGTLRASAAVSTIPWDIQPENNLLGDSQFDADPLFRGQLDDVLVLNYTMNAAQIAARMGNTAPTFASPAIDQPPVQRGSAIAGTLAGLASDPDAGDTLVYRKIIGPSWLTVSANGALSGIAPQSGAKLQEFVIAAVDSRGGSGSAVLRIPLAYAESYSPIAWYKAVGGNGPTLVDASPDGNDAMIVGSHTFVPGIDGNALDLSGGHVQLPSGIVSTSGNFTAATWVNLDSIGVWSRIFDFGSGTDVNVFLTPSAGGTNRPRFGIKNGGNEQTIDANVALQAGQWNHVAVTIENGVGKLFINGALAGQANNLTLSPADLGATTANYLGRSQYPDPLLNGKLDDFRLYNRAITDAELQSLIARTTPATPTGLAGVPGNQTVSLTWDAVAPTDGIAYTVKRATHPAGNFLPIATGLASTAFHDTGLINGQNYYYKVSATSAFGASDDSEIVVVTPSNGAAVTSSEFHWQSRQAVLFTFDRNVAGQVDSGDLVVQHLQSGATVSASLDSTGMTATFTFPAGLLANGDYRATLDFPGLSALAAVDFFVLAGDANRDRKVDLSDFVILRNNFGSTGSLFSQADFNYDGNVDLQDFVILRNNFGTILPGPDDDE